MGLSREEKRLLDRHEWARQRWLESKDTLVWAAETGRLEPDEIREVERERDAAKMQMDRAIEDLRIGNFH